MKVLNRVLFVELPLAGGFEIGCMLAVVFLTTHLPCLGQLCYLSLPPGCCRGPPAYLLFRVLGKAMLNLFEFVISSLCRGHEKHCFCFVVYVYAA